jgi:hypothetical protein
MEARLSTRLVIQIQNVNCTVQEGAATLRRFTKHLLFNKTSAKNITSIPLLFLQTSDSISQICNTFLSFTGLAASCNVFPFPRLLPHMLSPFYPSSSCSLHPLRSYFSVNVAFLRPYYCLIYLVVNLLCFCTLLFFVSIYPFALITVPRVQ